MDRLESRVAAVLASRRWWFVGVVAFLYFSITCGLAQYKLFWNDELFTVYIARLPTLADIWTILATGVEQLPPTFHILTRLLIRLAGEHHLTVRLPAILGVGAMEICVFLIASRHSSTAYGLLGMLVPLTTQAYPYAYEARPYGLVLAFAAASFLCWQAAAAGHWRTIALPGLAVALAGALASHYYGVLLFAPLAAGEIVRSFRRRRLDPWIWLAFALATLPLWAFLPLIQAGRKLGGTFWARPQWRDIVGFYQNVFGPTTVLLLGIVLVVAIYAIARSSTGSGRPPAPSSAPPLHEVVAGVGYLTIPVIAVVLAKFVTGAFTDRYALAAVLGLAVVVPWGTYQLLDRRATMGVVLATFAAAYFMVYVALDPVKKIREDRFAYQTVYELLRKASAGDLPLVVANPHAFFQLTYYAPPRIASRFVYLADPAGALRHLGSDTVDLGVREFGRWTPLMVEDYGTYVRAHPRFLLYVDQGAWAWLLPELVANGARIRVVGVDGTRPVLEVDARPEPHQHSTPR